MNQLIGYLSEGEQLKGRLSDPDRLVGELSMPAFLGGGLSEEVKQALLDLFQHLAYTDADGQDYYDALYNAFYPPAELVRITAVYTQTSTVFPDTSLDDLKDDLVVTAHYSDSTTEAVPSTDYTLSGTLTAGTSTVTVTYEDKTTTFNVTVSEPAVLSSITAVYTQSGTVYPTDSLDSLKPDLVVTAHYSDSSTATVTTYTLSGTLTVGTSTITVTYSGKTTTFNVTVTAVPVLDSITAVYTQSGTVYDTDSLDSLKSDLVVTAVYTDSSTETVPSTDYTLSGTLAAGTSTVTVSYEGKTATFSVTVTAAALYPMQNGTHEFTASTYTGRSVTVTNGNHVKYHNENSTSSTSGTVGSYVILDPVLLNSSSANSNNVNAPTNTIFTIPNGANVVMEISNIQYSGKGGADSVTKYAMAWRMGTTSSGISTGDLTPTTTEKTVTATMTSAKNITHMFLYAGVSITDLEFDVSLTVNGARWI